MTSAVLTPFTAGKAVELGNRVWRKKLLPVGEIDYKGRTLKFTRDYLGQIVSAFNGRAYDMVPFQLADAQNTHSNDPERTRGEITGMELGPDGLYVTAALTPDGEKVLAANPKLGVSARIVEDYARSDGQFFKSAVQHVLGTLDPRIPGLGAWEAIEAASPVPDAVLDLTNESFVDLVGPEGYVHGWKKVGAGTTVVSDKDAKKPAGWLGKGTKDLNQGEAADRMSKNISRHTFSDGAAGFQAKKAHQAAASAHRAAAKNAGSQGAAEHHTRMAKAHASAASGRTTFPTDLAGDGTDPEGGAAVAGLKSLTDEQRARLEKLLALPDETLEALAAGGTVVTPQELEALTAPDEGEDEADEGDELAAAIDAMSDDELAALEAEWEAEAGTQSPVPDYVPEGEPVAAGLSAEAQFAIDLANAKAEENGRMLAVVTARLAEEDFQGEKRRLADLGVPPYITELAKPLLEGAGHAVELANGKTVDAGAITRQVLTEFARQVKLLDLSAESGSPFDEPEDAGDGEGAQYRDDVVTRMKSAMGLK